MATAAIAVPVSVKLPEKAKAQVSSESKLETKPIVPTLPSEYAGLTPVERARKMAEVALAQHKEQADAQRYSDPHKNKTNQTNQFTSYSSSSRSYSNERHSHLFRNIVLIPTLVLFIGGYGYYAYDNNFDLYKTNYSLKIKATELYNGASGLISKVLKK